MQRRAFTLRLGLGLGALALGATSAAGCKLRPQSAGSVAVQRDQAPMFVLPDENKQPVALASELQKGPVVVVFYRGFW